MREQSLQGCLHLGHVKGMVSCSNHSNPQILQCSCGFLGWVPEDASSAALWDIQEDNRGGLCRRKDVLIAKDCPAASFTFGPRLCY